MSKSTLLDDLDGLIAYFEGKAKFCSRGMLSELAAMHQRSADTWREHRERLAREMERTAKGGAAAIEYADVVLRRVNGSVPGTGTEGGGDQAVSLRPPPSASMTECSQCGAAPGESCRIMLSGDPKKLGTPRIHHTRRWSAARDAARAYAESTKKEPGNDA